MNRVSLRSVKFNKCFQKFDLIWLIISDHILISFHVLLIYLSFRFETTYLAENAKAEAGYKYITSFV